MAAAAKKIDMPAGVEIERYTGRGAESVKSVYRVSYEGTQVAWLIFPNGWGEMWRMHRLISDANGQIEPGINATTRAAYTRSKEEALAKVPDLVASGDLYPLDVAVQRRAEADAKAKKDRAEWNEFAREHNAERANAMTTFQTMLDSLALTDEQRRALTFGLKTITNDTYDIEIKEV